MWDGDSEEDDYDHQSVSLENETGNENDSAICVLRELVALRRLFVDDHHAVFPEKALRKLGYSALGIAWRYGVRDDQMRQFERGWGLLAPLLLSALAMGNIFRVIGFHP